MQFHEYPKALYKGESLSDTVTVTDAGQESAARANGYTMHGEQAAPVAPVAAPEKRTYNRKAK
jgi:hypothetical protein